ncbi:MMB_0454 family protein [Mycoplasmopsis alligatoris]|uniref:Uncharacterized protein n=1 Tax=Mycoplasmopsis alligatoris A21JP2 TaxID=747682 RepID=D4XW11_9BACT|nr:hypothetical protein [Mycoplasmopsis alligatoris]EFF41477.1 hypothetical protein MALL_0032 [Mycoplasmopsis alligatoris A21JP2]
MNLVNLSYSLNQTYLVHESAFKDVIPKAINEIKYVKLVNDPRISFDEKNDNVEIYLELKFKTNKDVDALIKKVFSKIEEETINLIDITPKNIQVRIIGFY